MRLFSGILAGGLGEAERRLTTDFRTLDGWGFTVTFLIVSLAANVVLVLSCANAVANMSREPRWGNAVLYSGYILRSLLIGLFVTRIPVVDGAAYQALMWLGKVPVAIMQVIFGVLELASWLMLGFLVAGVVLWQWGRATVLPVLDARDGGSGYRGCCDLGVAAGFLVSQFLGAALVFSMVPHVDPDSALGRLHEAWTTSLLPWPTGVVLTLLEACLPPGSAGALREVFGVYDPTIDCVIMTVVAMVAVATLALGSGTWRRVRKTVLLAARASASLGVACIFALVLAWIEDASS